jgi:hypothetical protein
MSKDLVLKLKFLGVIPQAGYVEYGFRIEAEDKSYRLIILTIEDAFFRGKDLMFQEAPDLCYQKILVDLNSDETTGSTIPSRIPVTSSDIARYRDLHPNTKLRRRA